MKKIALLLTAVFVFSAVGYGQSVDGTWYDEKRPNDPDMALKLNNGRIDSGFLRGTYTTRNNQITITVTEYSGLYALAGLGVGATMMGINNPNEWYTREKVRRNLRDSVLGMMSSSSDQEEMLDTLFLTETVPIIGGNKFTFDGSTYVKGNSPAHQAAARQAAEKQQAAARQAAEKQQAEQKQQAEKNAIALKQYLASGNAAYDRRDYDKAIADFTAAIRLVPDAYYYYLRAFAYDNKGDKDHAIADLTEAIRLNPIEMYYNHRGLIYHYGVKDYDKSIADYTEAIRLKPDHAFYYYCRATVYVAKKDYDKAIADFTEALRLEPYNRDYYYKRAEAYMAIFDYDNVIADSTEIIRRFSDNNALAYSYRAKAYMAKTDYDKAIADVNEAIRLNPNFAVAYRIRAEAYIAKKDYINAIADYTAHIWKTSQSNERDSAITERESAYSAYMAKKDYNKAIADFTELIRLKPEYTDFYAYRAEAYFGKRDYKKAREDVNVALRGSWNWNRDVTSRIDAELKKKKF